MRFTSRQPASDHTGARPVAAIVYQRKNHFVNDFDVQSHQGYSLCGWNKAGLNYVIISEFSEAETERFEDLLREQIDEPGEPVEAVRLYGIKEYPICFLLICRRAYK